MHGPDEPSTLAYAQVGSCGQQQLRIHEYVAFGDIAVRIRKKLDGPFPARIFDIRYSAAENAPRVLPNNRVLVPRRHFLGKSADRLLSQDCDNALKTRVLGSVKVNDV